MDMHSNFDVVSHRAREALGYSLIEVLTVLVIMGIAASLAAPRLNLDRYRMNSAVESVGSALLAAQRQAVQRQHNVVLAVDAEQNRLRVHLDMDNDLALDAGEPIRFVDLEEGVRIGQGGAPALLPGTGPATFSLRQGGLPAVVFYRGGSVSEEGGFYLASRRAAKSGEYARESRAVLIERSSGRPTWYRFSPPDWVRWR